MTFSRTRHVVPPTPWMCFTADRARYPRNAWLAERSLWAIAVYRFGQAVLSAPWLVRSVLRPLHRALILASQLSTNIEIGTRAQIGPGLRIHHVGPIVINNEVTIGAECTLRVGNILGNRNDSRCPRLGDRVTLGAGAQVLGAVTVGDDVIIGAMSLVIHDVPANTTVAGIPARSIGAA
jgi:serine O-acetyltransferase